jgi:signal transduction histidine kinase
MGAIRGLTGVRNAGGPEGFDPVAARRVIDAAAYLLAIATFGRFGDTEILLHAMWVALAIGAFVYGLRTALLRILIAAAVALSYSAVGASVGLPPEIEPLDLGEWPLMVAISLIVAVMADRLATSTRHYASLYRQASDRLLGAHEEERARVARDLHDGVGQTLTAMILTLDAAEAAMQEPTTAETSPAAAPIRRAQVLAAAALEEVRDVAAQLRPARIHEVGLGAALSNLALDVGRSVEVRLDPADLPPGLLGPAAEIDAYRIVQEALGNAARHSSARHVWIDGGTADGQLWIEVGDDGTGFDTAGGRRGLGLDGMIERAAMLGGRLEIRSRPDGGTIVGLTAPLPDAPAREAVAGQPAAVRPVG